MNAGENDAVGPRRVRRPAAREALIERLRSEDGGAFKEIREVLMFAAVMGFDRQRFVPFAEATGESIRWETFTNLSRAEDVVSLIAVAHSEDKEIASRERQPEQLDIFEGYLNGGLAVIADALDSAPVRAPVLTILDLMQEHGRGATGVDALIDLAAGGLDP